MENQDARPGDPAPNEPGTNARGRYDPATDPMRMGNQPALQTSGGAIWIVMGALFAVIAIGTLVAIALTSSGGAAVVGWIAAAVILALFVAIVIVRLVIQRGRRRLMWMAGFFLAMAAVGLAGVWLTAVYNAATLAR